MARCVPGLADVTEDLYDAVRVNPPGTTFGFWPQSTTAPDGLPEDCQRLPRLGTGTGPELDVTYAAATDDHNVPRSRRFAPNDAAYVDLRVMAAAPGDDLLGAMNRWVQHCSLWRAAPTGADGGIQTWLLGESADALTRYQSGDIDGQWRRVTQMAAAVLPSGVIAQVWYRTDDPSASSRRDILSQLIGAVGRHRPRTQLPPRLADWTSNQFSTLLPPLAKAVGIDAQPGHDAGPPWTQCAHTGYPSGPIGDHIAEWVDADFKQWGQPTVIIGRARPGVDYLGDLRREIATCTAHLTDNPGAKCAGREDRRYVTSDTALADGEETVRFTHRWMRVENVQAYNRCVEGIEIYRVTLVRGYLVVTTAHSGGPKSAPGPSPQLPLDTLDELHAATVHQIKTA